MTRETKLPYCTLRLVQPDIVEAIVHEGVELSVGQVKEAHAAFDKLSNGLARGALISKLHSYTYTFAAQKELFNQPQLRALAYHAPDPTRRMALSSLLAVAKVDIHFPIEIFDDREAAIRWLRQKLDA